MTKDNQAIASWVRAQVVKHLQEVHSSVKPNVIRRISQRIGNQVLGHWLTCWDPIHFGSMQLTMASESLFKERLGPLIDLACEQILHGHILPIQRVLCLIDESEQAALGKCVCRASRVTADLEDDQGQVVMSRDAELHQQHWQELVTLYEDLQEPTGWRGEPTHPSFSTAIEEARRQNHWSATQRLAHLYRETFPYWEILLTHSRFTSRWTDNMKQHQKARPIDRKLLAAFVKAQYDTRGAIFTAMEVMDEPYAICTCPGPENDSGCSLVNWYYFSRYDHALYPNHNDFNGQARDSDGKVLPCQRFEERTTRPCLGCGCKHQVTILGSKSWDKKRG